MATGNITKRTVDALGPGDTLWDTVVRGFGVRRQKEQRVYVLKYRIHGRQRFFKIGQHGTMTPDQARTEAKKFLGQVAGDKDPAEAKAQARLEADGTLDVVSARYLRHAEMKQKPR